MQVNQNNQVCADCAASGISQQVRPDKARCACCGLVGGLTITPRAWWESQEQFRARAFASIEAHEAAAIEAAQAKAEIEAPVSSGRCPHYHIIREFAATAREMGCDMKAQDRARGAMGIYLGVRIQSRSELTAAQWRNALGGLKAGVLFW
ncbi:MAG TPA: hypothetical protein VGB77_21540 [Abditibacteriaceae bacterium]|jgi:hypothetical protein